MLQFKTGLQSVIKQKLAKKDGALIDGQNDIQGQWNFCLDHKIPITHSVYFIFTKMVSYH